MGPMHNHVIVKEFKDLRESTKELKLDLRESIKEFKLDPKESIKESGLELKEEMQEFRREANTWMRWLLGTYLGAVCCRETFPQFLRIDTSVGSRYVVL